MPLPPRLTKEIEQLESRPTVVEDGGAINLVFRSYPIPPGYNSMRTDLLVRVPLAYPDAGPDMFWTSPSLTLMGGAEPRNGNSIEVYIGERWRRFSWHTVWKPTVDNIHGYMHFIRRRLEQAC
jgi:hypothetical protein